jgi:hypothetical protein
VDEAGGWGGGDGDYWVKWIYVVADDLAIEIPILNLLEHLSQDVQQKTIGRGG